MIQYVVSLLILVILLAIHQCVIKPKREYNRYVRSIEKLGYKVYATPFAPFQMPVLRMILKQTEEGDCLKFLKNVFPTYDVWIFNNMDSLILHFSHPDFIKDFYSSEHVYTYPKKEKLTNIFERVMGKGILFSEGLEWKRKKRIVSTAFNFEFIKSITGKIEQLCSKAIQQIEAESGEFQQNGQKVVQFFVRDLAVRMFSSVTLQCFLGGAISETIEGKPVCIFLSELLSNFTKQLIRPSTLLFGPKHLDWGLTAVDRDVNKRVALFKKWGVDYVNRRIKKAKEKIQKKEETTGTAKDLVEAFVRIHANSQSNQDHYSSKEIFEEFSTFFVVGTDTTSYFLMMMIYYIAQNPNIEAKLRKQIDTFMPKDNYSYENLKNFTYIDNIQKQTTRMYGPINDTLPRAAKQDHILNGIQIKKGTGIRIQHMGNHYSEKYFKDPFIFRPERWQNQCDDIPAYVLGGFSAGARSCIGKHLALLQSKIALIKFMKRYKKIRIPNQPIKMVYKFIYSPEEFKSKMTIRSDDQP